MSYMKELVNCQQSAALTTSPHFVLLGTKTFDEASLNSYSDGELVDYIQHSPHLVTTRREPVALLSPNLVTKRAGYDYWDQDPFEEVLALKRARSAGVGAPAVRRLVRVKSTDLHYIVMERITASHWSNCG
ncbi:hypothetical protein BDZ89DRAFT_1126681 [Hymenopellis radicata]|nr:hypothetical protein BDZ89DRAFT_1126681 [Hymenopellis radicata]